MSESGHEVPHTLLRRSYQRARDLTPELQIHECIDVLENPELIVGEVLDAFAAIDGAFAAGDLCPRELTQASEQALADKSEPVWIYETRDLSVLGARGAFTCLSTLVDPLPLSYRSLPDACEGLDYVGLTCDADGVPVLGVVQSERDTTAYPLLLRLLTCLAEMAPAPQLERMNQQFFKGALPATPCFDLNLVIWEFSECEQRTPICQFTRDLSELVKKTILEKSRFPQVLRNIVCLRMNPQRFDGRLRFDWSV